jgi:hypothetical protein
MPKSEIQTLVEMLELTRDLTKFYLKKLDGQDLYKVFEIENNQLNSILWLIAHITVSENWLLLVCTGGEKVNIPWARQFGLGSQIPKKADYPPAEEIMEMFDLVHQKAIKYVYSLDDIDLAKPTTNGIDFGGEDSVRAIIKHSIRHEGTHTGHLSWLCKLFGVKTI